MAISKVNTFETSDYTGATTTTIVTPAFNLATGNTVVFGFRYYGDPFSIVSVSDTAGNTYNQILDTGIYGANNHAYIYYAYNTTANASNVITIVITILLTVQYWGISGIQYSGILTTNPLDVSPSSNWAYTTSATSLSTSAFTTTAADEVLVAWWELGSLGNIASADTGYTIQVQDGSVIQGIEDKIVSSIQTSVTTAINSNNAVPLLIATTTLMGTGGGGGTTWPGYQAPSGFFRKYFDMFTKKGNLYIPPSVSIEHA